MQRVVGGAQSYHENNILTFFAQKVQLFKFVLKNI